MTQSIDRDERLLRSASCIIALSQNLNVRNAAVHVLGDLLGSVAAIAAAALMLLFDRAYADPPLAVGIAASLSRGA